jgi:hypothetical protein
MSHTLAVILALVLLKVAMLGAMGGLFWGFFRSQPREADDWSETEHEDDDDDGGQRPDQPPVPITPRPGTPIRWRESHGPGRVPSPERIRHPRRTRDRQRVVS